MIKRVYNRSDLITADNYCGGKILSYCRAYDMSYDFCRFFSAENGSVLIYNMNMVIDGEFPDCEELCDFIRLSAPATIECSKSISEKLRPEGYTPVKRTLFEIKKQHGIITDCAPEVNTNLVKMCDIVCASFEGIEADLWYLDISHRIRHGVSQSFLAEQSCACVDFVSGSKAYISSVATAPESRGKGSAARLLEHIRSELEAEKLTGLLWCYPELEAYYSKLSFAKKDEDIIFIKKEAT